MGKEKRKMIIDNTIVPSDHKCWRAGTNDSVIVTETTFGHGDSSHVTYIHCKICGRISKRFEGWGFFDDKDLRKAQEDWNNNLKEE